MTILWREYLPEMVLRCSKSRFLTLLTYVILLFLRCSPKDALGAAHSRFPAFLSMTSD